MCFLWTTKLTAVILQFSCADFKKKTSDNVWMQQIQLVNVTILSHTLKPTFPHLDQIFSIKWHMYMFKAAIYISREQLARTSNAS